MVQSSPSVWRGWGRWLSLATGVYITLIGVVGIFLGLDRKAARGLGGAGGFNLFLGLLLIGCVASGNKRAPLLTAAVASLVAVRVAFGIALGHSAVGLTIQVLAMFLAGVAAYDLRRQARS